MNSVLAFHPQLHGIRVQTISSPLGGARHIHGEIVGLGGTRTGIGNPEAPCRRSDCRVERLPRPDGPALLAGPGAEAALPGTAAKVGVVLGIRERLDPSLDAHLTVL